MKAIQVKYLSATNSRGGRFKAMAEGVKSITLSYDYSLNADQNAFKAAKELVLENNWPVDLVSGQLPNGDYVFCFKNQ